MDKQGFVPPYEGFDYYMPPDGIVNPINQYEQMYWYYRYLTQQMEYRIKCKELEKLDKKNSSS